MTTMSERKLKILFLHQYKMDKIQIKFRLILVLFLISSQKTPTMMLPGLLLLILLLEEVVAGDGQSSHQHNKLVKIHLVVLVGIQVAHDFLHQHRIFLGLQTGEQNISCCLPTNGKCGIEGVDMDVRRATRSC